MEGIPEDILEQHRNRIIQNFYQAREDRRIATGNPLPGQNFQNARSKIKYETTEELLARFAEWRIKRENIPVGGGAMEGVVPTNPSPGSFVSTDNSGCRKFRANKMPEPTTSSTSSRPRPELRSPGLPSTTTLRLPRGWSSGTANKRCQPWWAASTTRRLACRPRRRY
jgi:hypothetical protein